MVVGCLKSLVLGNGIDIQYGGFELRGNSAIISRAVSSVESNKYLELGWAKNNVKDILEKCVGAINMVLKKQMRVPASEDYLFLQMEMERIRRMYPKEITIYEVGLEDVFLGAELLYVNAIGDEEKRFVQSAIHDYLQPLFLDAIYDDGKVNDIYNKFPSSLIKYLKRYDAIFTLNYDTNLESVIGTEIPIYHLHGCFSDYTDDALKVPEKFRHMFCNGIMTWYWLEKYGEEETDKRYGTSTFVNIEGTIDILGISPCNDEQLYIRLWQNPKLTNCNYFYYDRNEAIEIRKHIKGTLERHITVRDVKRFWEKYK
jgi:hypothetical protein